MSKPKLTSDYSVHFEDAFEIADGEYETPVYKLVIYDEECHGHDVREFTEYPSLEEVHASISSFRKGFKG